MENEDAVIYMGETNFRGKAVKFGIKVKDRTRHMYVIGKSGVGKSTLLENMAVQDIQQGRGLGFLDPHGGSADKLLEYIPDHRRKDVIYFAPFDTDYPISFNVMENVEADKRHLVADGLLSAFKKIWGAETFSARMETILRNTLLALLETPDATLLGVNRMLSDKDYRKWVVAQIKDDSVRSFWINEYGKWDPKYATEAGAAIQNKIGQFTANPIIRNIIGQPKSTFDFREAMDTRKILVLNLSKGRMGDESAALLGAMIITKVYLAAMSRADATAAEMARLPSFSFYADEFQNFANDSFANILSEARKYKLALTLAHQYVEQLPEAIQSAVKGNMGSMVVFRVGASDAELFEKEFAPVFLGEDFTNLGFAQMYLRITIDGIGSKPFSATSLPPIPVLPNSEELRQSIIENSRAIYSQRRAQVETAISEWYHKSFSAERPARASEDPSLAAFLDQSDKPKAPKNVFHAAEPFVPRKVASSGATQSAAPQQKPTEEVPAITKATNEPGQHPLYQKEVQEPRPEKLFVSGDLGSLLNQLDPTVPVVATKENIEAVPEPPKAPVASPQPARQPILIKAAPAAPAPILVKKEPVATKPAAPAIPAQPQQKPQVAAATPRPITPQFQATPIQKPVAAKPAAFAPKSALGAQADKSAPIESRDALRSVLEQAMKSAQTEPKSTVQPTAPVIEKAPDPVIEPKPEATATLGAAPTQQTAFGVPVAVAPTQPITQKPQSITDFRPKAVKEVPEDILRRVLE